MKITEQLEVIKSIEVDRFYSVRLSDFSIAKLQGYATVSNTAYAKSLGIILNLTNEGWLVGCNDTVEITLTFKE